MAKYTYETKFNLTNPVNDIDAAVDYLQEDYMVGYLKDEMEYKKIPQEYIDAVENIVWDLKTADFGVITLTTNKELPPFVLSQISDWVSGQNSDGLGEGFEQQPFAEIYDEDEYGDPIEDTYDMASFDWQTNNYPFTLIRKSETNESVSKVFSKLALEHIRSNRRNKALTEGITEPTERSPLCIDAPRGPYYIWVDDGSIYGSVDKPDPTKNVVDARSTVDFTGQGFEDLDEVIAYVKKYF